MGEQEWAGAVMLGVAITHEARGHGIRRPSTEFRRVILRFVVQRFAIMCGYERTVGDVVMDC